MIHTDLASSLTRGLVQDCPEIINHYSERELESVLWWHMIEIDSYLPCNDNRQLNLFDKLQDI